MEGAGNDFMVVDATERPFSLSPADIQRLADRHRGIGFDQLLVIEPARTANTDFYYRIFNSDGNEVNQCGNGARCFVRYVHDKALSGKSAIRVETASGIIEPRLEADGNVSVDMGAPRFEPKDIPMSAMRRERHYVIDVDGSRIQFGGVSMGNPHAVQLVSKVDTAPVATQGPLIEHHEMFPEQVNAGFMEIVDRHQIRLRVWERGSGETLACGTGACAAVVTGIQWELLDSPVCVHTRGGDLHIAWAGEGNSVLMTGPARTVYEGQIEI